MRGADFTTCAYCPRLCRHVCPVAVATAREAATPSAMMTAALLVAEGHRDAAYAREAASLCLDCGACSAHCKLHVPVADRLLPLRGVGTGDVPNPVIIGESPVVCVWTEVDWSAAWGRRERRRVASAHAPDELGHAAWRAGYRRVLHAVADVFAGRTAITASGAAAEVLSAAGVPVERLRARSTVREFRSCHDAPAAGASQLGCCGRRDGYAEREPAAAAAVARENVRRFEGHAVRCDDERCAAWLREAGATVTDPIRELMED